MKRIIALSLALLMLVSVIAIASEVPRITDELLCDAKLALVDLVAGDYEHLTTLLPFSDATPTASEWQEFAENNFSVFEAEEVQTDYAVAYWNGSIWNIAVPSVEPDDDVKTLVLFSSDGATISGYDVATWAEVKGEYLFAPYVIWDKEYIESSPVIAID